MKGERPLTFISKPPFHPAYTEMYAERSTVLPIQTGRDVTHAILCSSERERLASASYSKQWSNGERWERDTLRKQRDLEAENGFYQSFNFLSQGEISGKCKFFFPFVLRREYTLSPLCGVRVRTKWWISLV